MKHIKRFNESDQLIREYTFDDMNQMTDFISKSMKVFESQNHHPHYFHWKGSKLLISLKTHSSNSVTQKDWDVASQLDNLI
jgi:pterin-4a-carbinolamine dehydratase